METLEDKIAKDSEIKVEFCRRVIPSDIFRYLPCLTHQDIEKVQAVERNDGPSQGAEILHQRLTRRTDWLQDLRQALLVPDVGLEDFGENLRGKCEQLNGPSTEDTKCEGENGVLKDINSIYREIIIENRQDKIGKEIAVEFCKRVIPSDIIRYLPCLTQLDIEKVQAEEKNNGPTIAANLLHRRLVRRPDWLKDLVEALANPDVGLTDFGLTVDRKLKQLTVVVDAPDVCMDGMNCGEDYMSGTELALPPRESEMEQAIVDETDTEPENTNSEIRQRVKLKVFDLLLRDITKAQDLPGVVSWGEQICAHIDKIVHKCIEITFQMETVEKLDAFWELYKTGGLELALSRDILTPERRQQMIEDAKREGVDLEESDFGIQVYIDENDYMFVKDTLLYKNAPLLARNTVESVLLHGRENPQYTQEHKNNTMMMYRRLLPHKIQLAFDDPFVQTFIPEYFAELSKHDPFHSIQLIYNIIADKLREQLSSPLAYHLSNIAYILACTDNLECGFAEGNENVVLSTPDETWSIPKDMWQSCLKYLQVNLDKMQFASELVLTTFAFNCLKGPSDDAEKNARLQKLQFFTFVACALYKIDMMTSMMETYKSPHQYLVEFLHLRWFLTGTFNFDKFPSIPSLVLPITKDIKSFLSNASENGSRLQFLLHLPQGSQIKNLGIDVPGDLPKMFDSPDRSNAYHLPPIVLLGSTSGEHNVMNITNDTSINKEIYLPISTKDVLSYVLSVAHIGNILGSGKVDVTISINNETKHEDEEVNSIVIHFQILPPRQQKKDEIDRIYIVGKDSVGQLRLNLPSYKLDDKDFSLLTDEFRNGLEVAQINISGTGLTGKQLFQFCESAVSANITQLFLSDNELIFDDGINTVGLGRLVSLEVLEMRNCQLKDIGLKKLKKDILGLRKLRAVDFSNNSLTANGLVILCTALRNSSGLRALRIHENRYGSSGGYILALFLETLEFLEILNICYCDLGDDGIAAIAEVLKAKNIKKINIRSNNIRQRGTSSLLKAFSSCRHLNHFEYGENDIGFSRGLMYGTSDDMSKSFLEMLDSCKKSMEYLGLWKCGLGKTSIFNDSLVLKGLTELNEIVLQANDLEDNHAMSIGSSIPFMKNLQSLLLRSNNIGPEGAKHLARGIGECPSLESVVLDRNKINDFEALQDLAEVAVKNLKNLRYLDISYNVEMLAIARETPKHKELITTLTNILPNAIVKEEDLLTRIESGKITILV